MDGHLGKFNPLKTNNFDSHWEPNLERKCPKCDSVFVTIKDCESCGFQFSFKDMKSPLSERGFYSLKEKFWESRGFAEKWLSLDKSRYFRSYLRKLMFRYETLVDYLTSNPESDIHPTYRQEFSDLVDELLYYDIDREKLFLSLEEKLNFERQSFLNEFYILLGEDQVLVGKSIWEHMDEILSHPIAGAIRIGTALSLALATFSLLLLATAYYQYLAGTL